VGGHAGAGRPGFTPGPSFLPDLTTGVDGARRSEARTARRGVTGNRPGHGCAIASDPRLSLVRPGVPVQIAARLVLRAARIAPCATCWGQGRLLEPARNGEGLVPVACEACLGTGSGWG
jgi:hypothetical protein